MRTTLSFWLLSFLLSKKRQTYTVHDVNMIWSSQLPNRSFQRQLTQNSTKTWYSDSRFIGFIGSNTSKELRALIQLSIYLIICRKSYVLYCYPPIKIRMHPPPSEVGNEVLPITTPPVSKTCNSSKQQEGGTTWDNLITLSSRTGKQWRFQWSELSCCFVLLILGGG